MTVTDDVQAERDRQDVKWGEQNHIDGTGPRAVPLRYLTYTTAMTQSLGANNPAAMLSAAAKEATDVAAELGAITWRDILLEEVFEAFAEEDAAALRVELIQVAAVAQQWVEALDRRTPSVRPDREIGGGDRG